MSACSARSCRTCTASPPRAAATTWSWPGPRGTGFRKRSTGRRPCRRPASPARTSCGGGRHTPSAGPPRSRGTDSNCLRGSRRCSSGGPPAPLPRPCGLGSGGTWPPMPRRSSRRTRAVRSTTPWPPPPGRGALETAAGAAPAAGSAWCPRRAGWCSGARPRRRGSGAPAAPRARRRRRGARATCSASGGARRCSTSLRSRSACSTWAHSVATPSEASVTFQASWRSPPCSGRGRGRDLSPRSKPGGQMSTRLPRCSWPTTAVRTPRAPSTSACLPSEGRALSAASPSQNQEASPLEQRGHPRGAPRTRSCH
mmetsp:Transcript_4433/g.12557  ORF Transcript_4433/g.12557 Transcript_4433/m.12557 type:complete len:312 (-) Transcript_4433:1249-2184(-)